MKNYPAWFYDETQHAGVDYNSPAQVAAYDSRHQKFRDYQKETKAILDVLKLRPEHSVIDLGVGTGAFTLHAAPYCKTIYAVDVSPAMLNYTRQKAKQAGLTNIVFCNGGFLTYEHAAPPADAVVSTAVLHHLPDFWKGVGLGRVAQMLKPGGQFYLVDVVFPVKALKNYAAYCANWVDALDKAVGPDFKTEAEIHLRDEYSTYDWIMEGLLHRAGFRIDKADHNGFATSYLCTKTASV